ncbi:YidC/Oxa1 family membrane protein insertase [Acidaminobacter sp. JC074]|uniref:YidC/Oxa1 family membrane protein insertase n=1 Tax=Acidaminobacter sp. JC074 TaxID=2530199 RepID=UPI001F117062|nr:YidC/Oxa1 family membrane protein insertase [Acidaminobacter sp. JC074]MCH4890027.1 YidC/Oxa1 family membrane protein insertase [Acidaminobacter sp. JC074]
MLDIIIYPIGQMMHLLYNFLSAVLPESAPAYGVAIIISTIFLKLILLPINNKQMKSTEKMQEIQPELEALQAKYKDDQEKLSQEMMKLYQEHGFNPFSSFVPMLIQMPIIIGFFNVIREPAKYIFLNNLSLDQINMSFLWLKNLSMPASQMVDGITNGIALGMDLPLIGSALPLLAILSAFTTYLSTTIGASSQPNNPSMKIMSAMMPAMIFFFALNMPTGLTLYWVVGNLFQVGQQLIKKYRKSNTSNKVKRSFKYAS